MPTAPAHDDKPQTNPSAAVLPVHHFIGEGNANAWLNRLSHEAWINTFHPTEHHTIEEFIGGLVRCARNEGEEAVINFLEQAEGWGFALDSFSYQEHDGRAVVLFRHVMIRNELEDSGYIALEKLKKSISSIKSIVSYNDVETDYVPGNACYNGEKPSCFSFLISLHFSLSVPLSVMKDVNIEISRQHRVDAPAKKAESDEHREDL
jgi:hypothetical protein